MADPLQQLKVLAELRESGVINEDEFASKKAALLSMVAVEQSPGVPFARLVPETEAGRFDPLELETMPAEDLVRNVKPADVEFWKKRSELFAGRSAAAEEETRKCRRYIAATKRSSAYWLLLIRARAALPQAWHLATLVISAGIVGMIGFMAGAVLELGVGASLTLVFLSALFGTGLAYHFLYYPDTRRVTCKHDERKTRQSLLESELQRLVEKYEREQTAAAVATEVYGRLRDAYNSREHRLLKCDWRSLRGIAFEDFLKDVFENTGHEVETTKASGDQGVDLILTRNGERIAVQVKGYESSVGNGAVQEAIAGMTFYTCGKCAVVTNSAFTSSARELAARANCRLVDGQQIESLILGKIRL